MEITFSHTESTIDPKTKELMVYIVDRIADQPSYGATLLNKTFYLIDCLSYLETQKPMSSFKYIRQDFGPTPKPSQFLQLKDELIRNEELTESRSDFFGRVQKRLVANRKPSMELFDKGEILLIDKVIATLSNTNASRISHFTHQLISWQLASNMEEMPFNTFMLTSRIPNDEDVEWAIGKIKSRRSNVSNN